MQAPTAWRNRDCQMNPNRPAEAGAEAMMLGGEEGVKIELVTGNEEGAMRTPPVTGPMERDWRRGRTGRCRPIGRRRTGAARGKGARAERPWPNREGLRRPSEPGAWRWARVWLGPEHVLQKDRIWLRTRKFLTWEPARTWEQARKRRADACLLRWR